MMKFVLLLPTAAVAVAVAVTDVIASSSVEVFTNHTFFSCLVYTRDMGAHKCIARTI